MATRMILSERIRETREKALRLLALLDAEEPGLSTWHQAVGNACDAIAEHAPSYVRTKPALSPEEAWRAAGVPGYVEARTPRVPAPPCMGKALPPHREPWWVHLSKRAMVARIEWDKFPPDHSRVMIGSEEAAFEVWTSPNGVSWELESCHVDAERAATYADYIILNQIGCHPNALPLLKACGCGRQYDVVTWNGLKLAGHHLGSYDSEEAEDDDPSLEMRTCVCGSTISVEQRKL